MSGTAEVYAALKARMFAASPGAALDPTKVAMENKAFNNKAARWYRATFLPGIPRSAGIGEAPLRHVGIFQIDVFEPAGADHIAATTEAERIASAFKRGLSLLYSGVVVHLSLIHI